MIKYFSIVNKDCSHSTVFL